MFSGISGVELRQMRKKQKKIFTETRVTVSQRLSWLSPSLMRGRARDWCGERAADGQR